MERQPGVKWKSVGEIVERIFANALVGVAVENPNVIDAGRVDGLHRLNDWRRRNHCIARLHSLPHVLQRLSGLCHRLSISLLCRDTV